MRSTGQKTPLISRAVRRKKINTIKTKTALVVVLMAIMPTSVYADIGLPMVAIYLPPAWLALIPIILIEAAVGIWLYNIPVKRAIIGQSVANCLSTLVGIPVTWAILALLQLRFFGTALGLDSIPKRVYAVTIQAPWLIPYEDDLRWMVPISFAVLTIPFCLMSIGVENAVLRRVLHDIPKQTVRAWAIRANIASYMFLLALMAIALRWPDPFKQTFGVFRPVSEAMMEIVFRLASIGVAK